MLWILASSRLLIRLLGVRVLDNLIDEDRFKEFPAEYLLGQTAQLADLHYDASSVQSRRAEDTCRVYASWQQPSRVPRSACYAMTGDL